MEESNMHFYYMRIILRPKQTGDGLFFVHCNRIIDKSGMFLPTGMTSNTDR